ncbi:XRE family transcriptional regulator [Streptomyces lydicus]|uniref:XRE family transcriptional regulator n=1 Tax=Streptomyces lydicus TaxID=47763 RepID=UPI0036EBD9E8
MPLPPKAQDQLRTAMRKAGCSTRQIALELREQFSMRPREAWRFASGLTLQDAADRLNDLGGSRPGIALWADASLVCKWEKWPKPAGRRPSARALLLMAELYCCEVGDLINFADRQQLPADELQVLQLGPGTGDNALPTPPAASPAAVVETDQTGLVRGAAEEAAAWAQWASSSNVGEIAMEELRANVRTLARDYLRRDPLEVFTRTRRLRNRVFDLLEGHQQPRQTTELYLQAGYLCCLQAWMASDLSPAADALDSAETHARTSLLCAEMVDDNELRAWTMSTRSKIAFWDGRMKDAIAFARRGAECRPSGTAEVLLWCQEADAWSRLGAAAEAQAAMGRAEDARASMRGEDEVAGLLSCSEFRQVNYATAVHLRTGRASKALREAKGALARPAGHAYGTTAQMHITLACAQIAVGEPDGAKEALDPVLALPPGQRLAPVAARMRDFAAMVARSRMADGRKAVELQSVVEDWTLDSAPRRLALSPGTLSD